MKERYKILQMGVFLFIALISVGYLTIQLGEVGLFKEESTRIFARFTSVHGLKSGAPVEISGVSVGTVGAIGLNLSDDTAMVELLINKEINVTEDCIVEIKTAGIIGEKYINLRNGASLIILEEGSIILDTQSPIDVEDLISKYVFGTVNKN